MNVQTIEHYCLGILELIIIWFAWKAFLNEDTVRFSVAIISMALILIPSLMEFFLSIQLPTGTRLAVAIALLFHVVGGINQYYWTYAPYYDKVAHCISGFALGLVLFSTYLYLGMRGVRLSPSHIITGIIFLVFVFGVGWEIGELTIDALTGSTYNPGAEDTFFDMIGNTLGSLVAATYALRTMKTAAPGKPVFSILKKTE